MVSNISKDSYNELKPNLDNIASGKRIANMNDYIAHRKYGTLRLSNLFRKRPSTEDSVADWNKQIGLIDRLNKNYE